ncbi:MAG: beta-galactosidase, partial [Nitrospirota bacterium]|nr:beta-galactosidase [Nitrospirota bacterium]
MRSRGWQKLVLLTLVLNMGGCAGSIPDSPGPVRATPSDGNPPTATTAQSSERIVTVRPREIDDLLYNPGMGVTDFHFGFGHPPTVDEYPHATVAYFRWPWAELEPAEGQYNFALVDRVIEQAKAKGERLAIRIVSEYKTGTPQWLLDKGVASVKESDGIFPDYNNPVFLDYHERLIRAFGERYGQSLDIDHVDIGSVGCWGEWNTACCGGVEAQCK